MTPDQAANLSPKEIADILARDPGFTLPVGTPFRTAKMAAARDINAFGLRERLGWNQKREIRETLEMHGGKHGVA